MNLAKGYQTVGHRVEIARNGVTFGELKSSKDVAPTIDMMADAELKTWFSGTFAEHAGFNPLNDLLRPFLILDGADYQLGEFMVSRLETDEHGNMAIECYDKTLLLKQTKLEQRLYLSAGGKYLDVIQNILTECNIAKIIMDETEYTLQTDREDWEIGTSYLQIVNDLLKEINYMGLWFDRTGTARIQHKLLPSIATVAHTYKTDEFSIIASQHKKALDTYDAPNVFIATVNSPDYEEPLIATAVNDYATSALSTVNRGRRIQAPVERLKNIASPEALQEYVNNRRDESLLSTEVVQIETAKNPVHGVGDSIALQKGELTGVYEEISWNMSLAAGGYMQHAVRRSVHV